MSKKSYYFNVVPRYTPGSPAMVREEIARRVAAQEKDFYAEAIAGYAGSDELARAKQLGLSGIVERRREVAGGWEILDLCTGEEYTRKPKKSPEATRRRKRKRS